MRSFIIKLIVASQVNEEATVCVDASSLEEAIELFKDDPDKYEWYGWKELSSEVMDWEITEEECYDPLNAPVRVNKAT